jgi:hypothetical protein
MVFSIPIVEEFTIEPSGTISYGAAGTGKTVQSIRVIVYWYDQGRKIIVIYDEGRFEFPLMALPNDDQTLIDESPDIKPRGYPVECFIPASPGIPVKVPDIMKPFRIGFNDLDLEEFLILVGRLTSSQEELVRLAWRNKKKSGTFKEFIDLIQSYCIDNRRKINGIVIDVCDAKSGLGLLQKIDDLNQMCLLCDNDDPYRLDLDKIMRDKKTITCFSFAFLKNYNARHLVMGYLYRAIYWMRINKHFGRHPELVLVNCEVQNNAPARSKSGTFTADGQDISKEYLKRIGAEPRDVGIRLVCDSQDPLKIDSDFRKSFQTIFLFRLDRVVVETLAQQFWLPDSVKSGIQRQERGYCTLKCIPDVTNPLNHYGVQFNLKFPNPPCRTKRFNEHFFEAWRLAGRKFISYKIEKPDSLIKDEGLSKQEMENADSRASQSLYTYYSNVVGCIIEENPGISLKDLSEHRLCKRMGWNYLRVNRIVDDMASRQPPILRRVKEGNSWTLFPVEQPVLGV